MRKIALLIESASVILDQSDYGESRAFSNLPASSIEALTRKSKDKKARWILAEDGKLWVWDAYNQTHMEVMEKLGYEQAICGYIAGKPTDNQLEVYWEPWSIDATGENDDEDTPRANPKMYPIFNRSFSKPPFQMSSFRPH